MNKAKKKAEIRDVQSNDDWELMMNKEGLKIVDVYQDWAGPTMVLEETFIKLKRQLTPTEYLNFYTANAQTIDALSHYRGHCEPLLLFFASHTMVHLVNNLHVPSIEKSIEEQLEKEIQAIKGNRKREALQDPKQIANQLVTGVSAKGSISGEATLYRDDSPSLRSLLMKTAEKVDHDHWLNPEPYKLGVGLFVIKPDLVASRKSDEIFDQLRAEGFLIHTKVEKMLKDDEMLKIFQPESQILDEFHRFMTSGPSIYAVVSKGRTGRSTSDDLKHFIGPADPDVAKTENPRSLTAVYGTDSILNGFHCSRSNADALKNIPIVFPDFHVPIVEGQPVDDYVQKTAVLCVLGPAQVRSKKEAILKAIDQAGFEIRYEKLYHFRPDEVESLYIKHRNAPFFDDLVDAYTAGPSLLLYIAKEHCLGDFTKLLGPFSREEFSERPGTLRHDFDEPSLPVTTIHASETIIDARKEIEQFFPYQQTLAIIKPGLTPHQKDDILKRFNNNGFTIMMKETKRFSKEPLTQFYSRHQGLPWFDDFIQFMTSDVSEVIILAREDAVQALRDMMGPVDPVRAKTDAPDSIRAIYGLDIMRNALHASSNNKHARQEIRLLFPDYEFVKSRTLPMHTDGFPSQKNDLDETKNLVSIPHPIETFYDLRPNEIIYDVLIQTRSNEDEDRESAVFLTLIGKENETKKHLLQTSLNHRRPLQSEQTDRFSFVDRDIGPLKSIRFAHDGRGFPKNWFVVDMEVTVNGRNQLFKIHINETIDEEKIKTNYTVSDVTDFEGKISGNCVITIQTGSAKYAGTSADCSILLSGRQGVYSFPLRQSLTNRIPFGNRFRDVFLVRVDEELDEIEYVVLEHNNENSSPAWFVDSLRIRLLTNDVEYSLPVQRWLSVDYLDGKTKITLATNAEKQISIGNSLETRSTVLRYEILLVTGSMFDAGTSAPVWLTIHGTRDSIINKYLEIAENDDFPFEPSNCDRFVFYDVDVGEIDKLILAHESLDGEQGWFVQTVLIEIPSKNYRSETFRINKWFNSKRADGIPLLEIQVRKPTKRSLGKPVAEVASKLSVMSIDAPRLLYTIFILTEDFCSAVNEPKLFVDFNSTKTFLRLTGENGSTLRRDVLAVFRAYGSRFDQLDTVRLLIRSPDLITRWLPRYLLIQLEHNDQLFLCENDEFLKKPQRSADFQLVTLPCRQVSGELDEQLDRIKEIYREKTGRSVIDDDE